MNLYQNLENDHRGPFPKFSRSRIEIPNARFDKFMNVHEFTHADGPGRWESQHLTGHEEHPAVMALALTPEKKVVCVSMFRFPVESWVLELPGGELNATDEGKGATGTMREFADETGYSPGSDWELVSAGFTHNGKNNGRYLVYFATGCTKTGAPNLSAVEAYAGLQVIELTPDEIRSRIARIDIAVDPPIGNALIALEQKGII